jgi:hypothetical protein
MPRVVAAVPNVLLVVAGQAHPLLGRGYLNQLTDLATSLGVSDAIRFHSTFLSEPDLLRLYQVRLCAAICELQFALTLRRFRPLAERGFVHLRTHQRGAD